MVGHVGQIRPNANESKGEKMEKPIKTKNDK